MAGYERLAFAGAPTVTRLTSDLAAAGLSISIASATGWPSGARFHAVINPGGASEEKVLVSRSGTTLTCTSIADRGVDGTSAYAHSTGETIYPVAAATVIDQANAMASTLTTKGDVLVHTGSAHARQGVGTNDHALVADSAQANGVKWAQLTSAALGTDSVTATQIAAGAVGTSELADDSVTPDKIELGEVRLRRAANQATGAGFVAISWDTEDTDPDGYIAVTATTLTVPTGKGGLHLISAVADLSVGAASGQFMRVYVNGTTTYLGTDGYSGIRSVCALIRLAQSDTFTIDYYSGSGVTLTASLTVVRLAD